MNNKHLFFTVLEAGKSKIMVLADSVFAEVVLPGPLTAVFLLCPHLVEGARELCGVSFIRALIPFTGAPPS